MHCREALQLMDAYLESALTAEAAQRLTDHWHECAACRSALAEHRELLSALNDPLMPDLLLANLQPLPADFTAQVMQRVAAEGEHGLHLLWPWLRRRWSLSQYAGVAYALCTTLLLFTIAGALLAWEQRTGLLSSWSIESQVRWLDLQTRLNFTTAWLSQLWQTGMTLLP